MNFVKTSILKRNIILDRYGTSLNAVSQALKEAGGLTRDELFDILHIPHTYTTHNRYWSNSYNIKPWNKRSEMEKMRARIAATHLMLTVRPKAANMAVREVSSVLPGLVE